MPFMVRLFHPPPLFLLPLYPLYFSLLAIIITGPFLVGSSLIL
jgi:hypothetical protein